MNHLLRIREVSRLTGLSRPNIYFLMHNGAFPQPLKIGSKTKVWDFGAVNEWMSSRPKGELESVSKPSKSSKRLVLAAPPDGETEFEVTVLDLLNKIAHRLAQIERTLTNLGVRYDAE